MKKTFIIPLAVASLLAACSNSENKSESSTSDNTETSAATENKESLSDNPLYQEGLAIEAKNDCATCHKVDEKLVGPAYRDIAAKYASMPDTIVTHLAHKIQQGGSGVWGTDVMAAHPSLSDDDAKTLVRYIFLFKK